MDETQTQQLDAPHIGRMYEELADINERMTKLERVLFEGLFDKGRRFVMLRQLAYMNSYATVLSMRIDDEEYIYANRG